MLSFVLLRLLHRASPMLSLFFLGLLRLAGPAYAFKAFNSRMGNTGSRRLLRLLKDSEGKNTKKNEEWNTKNKNKTKSEKQKQKQNEKKLKTEIKNRKRKQKTENKKQKKNRKQKTELKEPEPLPDTGSRSAGIARRLTHSSSEFGGTQQLQCRTNFKGD